MLCTMAVNACRSARSSGGESHCLLLALSHDELGVVVDGLADPLRPVVAVAFSSTCKGLRTPLRAALELLAQRHAMAAALCRTWAGDDQISTIARFRDAEQLSWKHSSRLTAEDMSTFGMLLSGGSLPMLRDVDFSNALPGDAYMQAFCDYLESGAAPALRGFAYASNQLGPLGAEALAAALQRGALPNLEGLMLTDNWLGDKGVAALAPAARKMPALKELSLQECLVGDEGVTALVNLPDKNDFLALETLRFLYNKITDAGAATLAATLILGGLPRLRNHETFLGLNPMSPVAVEAVGHALSARLP